VTIAKDATSERNATGPKDDRDPQGSGPSPGRPPHESRMDRIARRAHEIYVARGGQHGKALEDWLNAETEIDAEMEAPHAED
jgi:Protein of unknown function (DUF2934)